MLQDIEDSIQYRYTEGYNGLGELEQFANRRRDYVASSLKVLIQTRIIDTVQDGDDEASLLLKCRLLALLASTQYPVRYLVEVEIDLPARKCILSDTHDNKRVYETNDVQSLKALIKHSNPRNPPRN
ncbi:uncharacterized protein LOC126840025 [Adelges cooleyi]|uniref:uncharacterized protein LOC126840025 n=1 Tax=Adelges cooleyi TaxID=133065 RepID=UPI00217FFB24|nr:uncharacterized protein LOC126840025 [Adelges cooleyi]